MVFKMDRHTNTDVRITYQCFFLNSELWNDSSLYVFDFYSLSGIYLNILLNAKCHTHCFLGMCNQQPASKVVSVSDSSSDLACATALSRVSIVAAAWDCMGEAERERHWQKERENKKWAVCKPLHAKTQRYTRHQPGIITRWGGASSFQTPNSKRPATSKSHQAKMAEAL